MPETKVNRGPLIKLEHKHGQSTRAIFAPNAAPNGVLRD